jgi:hypothetical protein
MSYETIRPKRNRKRYLEIQNQWRHIRETRRATEEVRLLQVKAGRGVLACIRRDLGAELTPDEVIALHWAPGPIEWTQRAVRYMSPRMKDEFLNTEISDRDVIELSRWIIDRHALVCFLEGSSYNYYTPGYASATDNWGFDPELVNTSSMYTHEWRLIEPKKSTSDDQMVLAQMSWWRRLFQ